MGILLCGLSAVAFCGLGVGGLLFPRPLAAAFGIPTEEPGGLSFVRATAARDLAFGVALGVLVALGERRALLILVLAGVLIPLTDFRLVRVHRGPARAQAVHGLAVLALLVTAALLRYDGTP